VSLRFAPVDVNVTGVGDTENGVADQLPSIFAAVQESLGLRLQGAKAPSDVVVIDRLERPSEN
jgi:uncharacterized protein (TIGR03435 family)